MSRLQCLILSASTGNGHLSAADAVAERLDAQGVSAKHIDALDHVPKAFRAWFRGGYELLVKRSPKMWGKLYRDSDDPGWKYRFQTRLDRRFCRRLDTLLARLQPEYILCTHSLVQPHLARWRAKGGAARIGVVVTDLYPHRMWLRGSVDDFFVPSDWSQQELERRLPSSAGKVQVTGIPVRQGFVAGPTADEAKRSLGLSEEPMLLISAGGIGAGPIAPIIQSLRGEPIQIVAACGRNEKAVEALSPLANDRVHIKGLMDGAEMALTMRAADLLAGKPGGITTFEALACNTPMLIIDDFVIPGQEEENAAFLVREGAAVRADGPEEAARQVRRLIGDQAGLTEMAESAARHAMPQSAEKIASAIRKVVVGDAP